MSHYVVRDKKTWLCLGHRKYDRKKWKTVLNWVPFDRARTFTTRSSAKQAAPHSVHGYDLEIVWCRLAEAEEHVFSW